jgi:hypothetical protein
MKNWKASIATLALAFSAVHALDPMYDYRYTLGPEILVPDAFHFGAGFFTRRNSDGRVVANLQAGLTDNFEIGTKLLFGTSDNWVIEKNATSHDDSTLVPIVDIGLKIGFLQYWAIQLDIAPIALNTGMDFGGVLSVSKYNSYTKYISYILEGRLGFGGASGNKDFVKFSGAIFPYFLLADGFRLSVGAVGSAYLIDIKEKDLVAPDDSYSMLDILPRAEFGFKWFRLMAEVSVGILTAPDIKKYNRYTAYIIRDI